MLEVRKSKKKIKGLQKEIDELNEGLKMIAEKEKLYLDAAARELASAKESEGRSLASHIKRKKYAEETADVIAGLRPRLVSKLVLLESRKKKEMEALPEGAENRTRPSCFFF